MKTKDILIRKCIKTKDALMDYDEKGKVKVAIACFGNRDRDKDLIQRTAYDKSIMENFDEFKHFKNHDPWTAAGKPLELFVEEDYLIMVSQLILESDTGRNLYAEYKAGVITQHSHGFNVINSYYDEKTSTRIITEGRIWEGSSLTHWGANKNTPTLDVKSLSDVKSFLTFAEKALHEGQFTDGYLMELEICANNIKEKIKSLKNGNTPPPARDTGTGPTDILKLMSNSKLFNDAG